jgi:acetolactate decarboxylase
MSTLYQCSHAFVFEQGLYDGVCSIQKLKQQGAFGLGTFDGLNGELTVLDGQCYHSTEAKNLNIADDEALVPWAAVTRFTGASCSDELAACATFSELEEKLLKLTDATRTPYAFHIQGEFNHITFRDVLKQDKPYTKSIKTIFDESPRQHVDNITADLVGFYTPEYMYPIKPKGLHLHGLSHDKTCGGHVLELNLERALVRFEKITHFSMDFPKK